MNRAGGGASIRTRFCQTIFLGIWIWQNRDSDFPRGGGIWGGIRAGFAFGFFWQRATRKNTRKMIKSFYEQSIRNVGGYRRKR